MINPLIAQIQKEIWAMEPKKLAAMFTQFLSADSPKLSELMAVEIQKSKGQMQITGGIATINIHGLLMKNPPGWLAWFGIETTDYNIIRQQLSEAVGNPDVQSIFLHIDSPGGTVAGVSEAAEAIANANKAKPVSAYIEDLGASGAYWLASQAGKITSNPNGEIGSIGVYTVYADFSKMAETEGVKVHVIRSGEHKGMGVIGAPISEEQIKAVQDVIDDIAANFKSAVSTGRKIDKETIEKIATGRLWLAAEAKRLNLIDEIVNGNQQQIITNNNSKGKTMAEEPKNDEKAITENATAAERKRTAGIKAAFPKDPAFALEQIEKGVSVIEAKAAYAEKLEAKNSTLEQEKNALQKKIDAKGKDPDPVTSSGEGAGAGTAGGEEFMTLSRQRATEKNISMTKAMQQIARENPASHQAYLDACSQKHVRLSGKARRIEK